MPCGAPQAHRSAMNVAHVPLPPAVAGLLRCFRSHRGLLLENLALRQQLIVFKRKRAKPRLSFLDKLFWVLARRFWPAWKRSLIVVTPETVARWHRAGFRMYWSLISKVRKQVGRKRISKEVRDLIYRMVAENPERGAPRIHGELLMLGFEVSERTISRWMKRAPREPESARRWLSFLRNHREAIAAMDFFTVPTVTFSLLYCFFIIGHDRSAFSTSTLPVIPLAPGLPSNCARPSRISLPPRSSSLITMTSMDWK